MLASWLLLARATRPASGDTAEKERTIMERPANAYCPRCSTRLGVETDPDYGWCSNHGPVRLPGIPPPLGIPERNSDRLTNACLDCEKPIYDNAKRCKACAGKASRGDKRTQHRGQGISLEQSRQLGPIGKVN